jgi:hypothetical protein
MARVKSILSTPHLAHEVNKLSLTIDPWEDTSYGYIELAEDAEEERNHQHAAHTDYRRDQFSSFLNNKPIFGCCAQSSLVLIRNAAP